MRTTTLLSLVLYAIFMMAGVGTLAARNLPLVYLTGTQTRGVAGRDAKLEGQSCSLTKAGVIYKILSCAPAGFWITDDRGGVTRYDNPQSAVGVSLPPDEILGVFQPSS